MDLRLVRQSFLAKAGFLTERTHPCAELFQAGMAHGANGKLMMPKRLQPMSIRRPVTLAGLSVLRPRGAPEGLERRFDLAHGGRFRRKGAAAQLGEQLA